MEKSYGNIKGCLYKYNVEQKTADTPWYADTSEIIKVEIKDKIVPESMECWFFNCVNLTDIENIENIDTTVVNSMLGLFGNCNKLSNVNVSKLVTSMLFN